MNASSTNSPDKDAEIQTDNNEISTIKEFPGAEKKEVRRKE